MSYFCPYCKKDIFQKKNVHLRWCNEYQEYKDSVMTKDVLENMYINIGMSANEIGIELGFNANIVIKQLKKLNIKTRSCHESALQTRQSEKRKNTNLENSGFEHNFNRNHPSRIKWESDLLEKEGITNVFQREDVKEKSRNTFVEKYKLESPGHIARGRKSSLTKPHIKAISILENENIEYYIEFKIKKETGMYYSYDILIKDTNRIIEIYGDYWHGNPVIYKPSDLILKGSSGEMVVSNKWLYDSRKISHAERNGYKVMIVWEFDINNDYENTKERIIRYANSND